MRRSGLVLPAIAVLLCCQCPVSCAKSVTLAKVFHKGQVDKYRLTMDMKMDMPEMPSACASGPMRMKMSAIFKQKVLDVLPNGCARVEITYTDFTVTSPQIPEMPKQAIPGQSIVMTLSPDGTLLGMDGFEQMMGGAMPGFDIGQLTGQLGSCGAMPTGPIEVGESWWNEIPLPFDCGIMNIQSTLLAAALPMGKDVASKIKQTFEAYIDLGAILDSVASTARLPVQNLDMAGGMQMVGWNVLYVSPQNGTLLKSNGNIRADFAISMPSDLVQMGAPSSLTMNMDMNIGLARI